MHHADDITITKESILIPAKELQPLGIGEGSICWGIWVPDNITKGVRRRPASLVISSFNPSSWHCLYRLVITLNNEIGSLAKASKFLVDNNINILSTQCSPSGHHFATWNVVCEALKFQNKFDDFELNGFDINKGIKYQDNVYLKMTKEFSEIFLEYSRFLSDEIVIKNKKEKFLKKGLNEGENMLYKRKWLSTKLIHNTEIIKSVRCSWLQNLAAFWFYNIHIQKIHFHKDVKLIKFKYEGSKFNFIEEDAKPLYKMIQEENKDFSVLKDIDEKLFPFKTMASFNFEEQFVRIFFPLPKEINRKIYIKVEYKRNFDSNPKEPKSTKGFINKLTTNLSNYNVNLDYISDKTTKSSETDEEGRVELIGYKKTKKFDKEFKDKIRSKVDNRGSLSKSKSVETNVKIYVDSLGAKKIFISTIGAWIKKDQFILNNMPLLDNIESIIKSYGFEIEKSDESSQKKKNEENATPDVVEKIRESHGFIMIIPFQNKDDKKPPSTYLDWLKYELGVANGYNIPFAICCCKKYPFKFGADFPRMTFITNDYNGIIDSVERALESLSKTLYSN